MRVLMRSLAAALVASITVVLGACAGNQPPVKIGLITKQEANPYWVTMREVAEDTARKAGATLITATGTGDVDVQSQRAALQDMVSQGVDGILIAPADSTGLAPDIEAARAKGITVIALDTPMKPVETTDAYFGTDNQRAGELVGEYARAKIKEAGKPPRVVMLNLAPGITSGEERAAGFQKGFQLTDDVLAAAVDSEGDQELARQQMAATVAEHPDVNVVYAVNEPAALGAIDAMRAAGMNMDDVVVVTVDGGCVAMREAVRPGAVDATAMQFPQNMARQGVTAIVSKVRDGQAPSSYLATGTELVSGSPAPGVASKNVEFGIRTCWG